MPLGAGILRRETCPWRLAPSLRRRSGQRVRGWKTPRMRSAEEAFASSPSFGGPKQGASHASVPPGSSRLPSVRRLQSPHHGGFVRGSARSNAPLLNRWSSRLPRGGWYGRATTGVRATNRSGKILGGVNRRHRECGTSFVLSPPLSCECTAGRIARCGHPNVRFAVRAGSELRGSCSGIHIIVEVVRRYVALRTPVNNRLGRGT